MCECVGCPFWGSELVLESSIRKAATPRTKILSAGYASTITAATTTTASTNTTTTTSARPTAVRGCPVAYSFVRHWTTQLRRASMNNSQVFKGLSSGVHFCTSLDNPHHVRVPGVLLPNVLPAPLHESNWRRTNGINEFFVNVVASWRGRESKSIRLRAGRRAEGVGRARAKASRIWKVLHKVNPQWINFFPHLRSPPQG